MIAFKNQEPVQEFVVIHPMFDVQEQKLDGSELSKCELSFGVRAGLVALRAYVIGVGLLMAYHVLDISGLFRRHLGGA